MLSKLIWNFNNFILKSVLKYLLLFFFLILIKIAIFTRNFWMKHYQPSKYIFLKTLIFCFPHCILQRKSFSFDLIYKTALYCGSILSFMRNHETGSTCLHQITCLPQFTFQRRKLQKCANFLSRLWSKKWILEKSYRKLKDTP